MTNIKINDMANIDCKSGQIYCLHKVGEPVSAFFNIANIGDGELSISMTEDFDNYIILPKDTYFNGIYGRIIYLRGDGDTNVNVATSRREV